MNEDCMPKFVAWIFTRGIPRLERWNNNPKFIGYTMMVIPVQLSTPWSDLAPHLYEVRNPSFICAITIVSITSFEACDSWFRSVSTKGSQLVKGLISDEMRPFFLSDFRFIRINQNMTFF